MSYHQNPVLCRQSLNVLRKRRPAEEENCLLLLGEITVRTLHQLYSFVSGTLVSSENVEKSESKERFKHPVQALPSNVAFCTRLNSTG